MRKYYESWLFLGAGNLEEYGDFFCEKLLPAYVYWLLQIQLAIKPGVAYQLLTDLLDQCPARRTLHRSKLEFEKKIKPTPIKNKKWVAGSSCKSASKIFKVGKHGVDLKIAIELTSESGKTTASAKAFIPNDVSAETSFILPWFTNIPLNNLTNLPIEQLDDIRYKSVLPTEYDAFICKLYRHIEIIPLTLLAQLMALAFPKIEQIFGIGQRFNYQLSRLVKRNYPNIRLYKEILRHVNSEHRLICFSSFALVVEPNGFLIITLKEKNDISKYLNQLRQVDKAELEISKFRSSGRKVCFVSTDFYEAGVKHSASWDVKYHSPNFYSESSSEIELKSRCLKKGYQVSVWDFYADDTLG